jgi:hypothetical protein
MTVYSTTAEFMEYLKKAAVELSVPLQKHWEQVYAKAGGPALDKDTGWEDLHANLSNAFTHFALIDLKLPFYQCYTAPRFPSGSTKSPRLGD